MVSGSYAAVISTSEEKAMLVAECGDMGSINITTDTMAARADAFESRMVDFMSLLRSGRGPDVILKSGAGTQYSAKYSDLNSALLELMDDAGKVIRLNNFVEAADGAGLAGCCEAQHWKAVSVETLRWSQVTLLQQLQRSVKNLSRIVDRDAVALDVHAAKGGGHGLLKSMLPATPAKGGNVSDTLMSVKPPPGFEAMPAPFAEYVTKEATSSVEGRSASSKEEDGEKAEEDKTLWPCGTLRSHLEQLQEYDPSCVLLVRRINRLGFDSACLLEEHFRAFGGVINVLVAHSRARTNKRRSRPRIRPAGLAFITMTSTEAADNILSVGEHFVNGIPIEVQTFQGRFGSPADYEGESDADHTSKTKADSYEDESGDSMIAAAD